MNLSKARNNNKEITLVQDWFCDRCEYKNFAKRIKCKKCENPRNHNCKVVYNSPAIVKTPNQGSGQYYNINYNDMFSNSNCASIMIRGHGLLSMNEGQIVEWFSQYLKIKDATIIRNKQTGQANEIALIGNFRFLILKIRVQQSRGSRLRFENNRKHEFFYQRAPVLGDHHEASERRSGKREQPAVHGAQQGREFCKH